MTRAHGRLAAGTAAALMVTGLAGGGTAGAAPGAAGAAGRAAQVAPEDPVVLVGDFTGDSREEAFAYWYGATADSLVSFSDTGSGVTTSVTRFDVRGDYRPVVADIDPDPQDEIIWYAPGAGADTIWDFTSTTTVTSRPTQISGEHYLPVAGNLDGVGNDEVFWYAPGPWQDSIWSFDDAGSRTSFPQTVNGWDYVPVVESFGADATDDIFWHDLAPERPDPLWDFRFGDLSHGNAQYQVTRPYDPVGLDLWGDGAGGGDVFWYGTGTNPDNLWDFRSGALYTTLAQTVSQHHWPVVAGDFLGDGWDDVLFFRDAAFDPSRTAVLWDHEVSGTTLRRDVADLGREDWMAGGSAPSPQSWTRTDQLVATR